jgi:serine protease Do
MGALLFFLRGLCLFVGLIFGGFNVEGAEFFDFSTVAEKSLPGVVNIRTKLRGQGEQQDTHQLYLNGQVTQDIVSNSLGTGIIYDKVMHIVTNYHVIQNAKKIFVLFINSKKMVEAKVIGIDRVTDLALLRVPPGTEGEPMTLGNSDMLKIGEDLLAIGNPFGYSHTVTRGILSAKGRVIGTGPYDNWLQTDALIYPGNSGGPLLDKRGRVVGINTKVSRQAVGIGFAIPSNLVKEVVEDLKRYGKVIRPWLGITGKDILSLDDVAATSPAQSIYGVIVSNLIIEGPAYKAGVHIGDFIMGIDTTQILNKNDLSSWLYTKEPKQKVILQLFRRGKGKLSIALELGEIPKNQALPKEDDLF